MPTPTEWLNESRANTGAAVIGNQSKPQIIGLSNGNILVAWQDDALGTIGSAGDEDIIGKIFSPDGTVVVDSFRLNASRTADNEREFSVAATNDGGFIIAYVDNDISSPNNSDLVFERKNASGAQTAFGTIATETSATTSLLAPSVAVNLIDNSFLVSWTTIENGNDNVRGRHFSPTNVGGTEFAAGQSGTDDDLDSDTAILTNGNFVTVYEEIDAGVTGVEFKINTSAGGFVASSNISSGENIDPVVASLTNGNWVAVWTSAGIGNGDVFAQIFTASGASVVPAPLLVAIGPDFQNEPMVVALPDGGFVVAWDNDTDGTLEARAFNAAGAPDGSTVVISPVATTTPSASVTADGRVLFAWVTESSPEIFWSIWDPRGGVINFANYDLNLPNVLETTVVRAGLGPNTITGTTSDNTMLGGPVNDTIFGGDGNDTLFGGAGVDSISGGNNDDTIIIKDGEFIDHVNGGAGTDTLDLSLIVSAGQAVDIDLEALKMTGLGGTVTVDSIEVIIGTALNDIIFADDGRDTIRGGIGNDTLGGGFAEDFVFGEAGDDRFVVRGGEFLDNVDGGVDTDTLDVSALSAGDYSGATVDFSTGLITTTFATDGSVTVASIEAYVDNAGSNTILDSSSNMTIAAGDGDDTVIEFIQGGVDKFDLGGGTDTLVINNTGIGAGDVFDGGAGTDTIDYSNLTFSFANSVVIDLLDGEIRDKSGSRETVLNFENVTGSQGNETIEGTNGANIISGREGSDSVLGHGGEDLLNGGAGNDTLDGGADVDTASYQEKTSGVNVLLNAGNFVNVLVGGVIEDSIRNVENVIGGTGADVLQGDALANNLSGWHGNDDLRGNAGNDTLDGGDGIDRAWYTEKTVGVNVLLNGGNFVNVLVGGVVEDTIRNIENVIGGTSADLLQGDALANNLSGWHGSDDLRGNAGNDTLDGGDGVDRAWYTEKTVGVNVLLNGGNFVNVLVGGVVEDSIRNIENVIGGTNADVLQGDALANNLEGWHGNDDLRGNAGNDTLDGGDGIDRAWYTEKTVAVNVLLNGGNFVNVLVGGVIEDSIRNIENVIGGTNADVLQGDALANNLSGWSGNDDLRGNAGNDTLDGGDGIDRAWYTEKTAAISVTLNAGNYVNVLVGGVVEDSIRNIENVIGGTNADLLQGDALANNLSGWNGNDTLNGALGNDTLTGGLGNDHFVFSSTVGAGNIDTIIDFQLALDKLVLDDDIFTALGIVGTAPGVALTASLFQLGAAANDAGDRIVYNQTSGQLFYDTDGNGAAAQQQIALIGVSTHAAITAGDFLVVA